ncbi:hypothetical protein CPB85DRAFT_1374751 [Mucidula mucida]|nr:hypothetical protein CPB85DRAFT_1374751 [Mucidula mucida]
MGRTKTNRTKVPVPQKSKLKKDPGIPRLPDLKMRNAEKQRNDTPTDGDSMMASEPTLSTLAQQIADDAEPSSSTIKTKEQLRKYYLRTLHKVIEQSDIVVLVLDARDPEGCRSRLVEEEVRRHDKTLVFVLNKVDLIPKENAQAWLSHLRHSTPTLPFRAPSSSSLSGRHTTTAPALMKLLKAYKPKAGSVTVGVVGYPNVGKSSLINSLKRSKRGMRIVDSPGVVFDEDDFHEKGESSKGSILLRNVVKVEDVDDPVAVVQEILTRTPRETITKLYGLPEFTSTLEFLTMLALKSGRLLKGGTPDLLSAARHVLMDWNHQKIPYFSVPPVVHPSSIPSRLANDQIAPGAEAVGQAQILTEFSKPFTLPGLDSAALFGVADAGAFGDAMEEDVFFDAQENFDDEPEMQVEERLSSGTRRQSLGKHARSPSPTPPLNPNAMDTTSPARESRQPKRQRKTKDAMLDETHLASRNPLNRGVMKKERKRERKLARMRDKALNGGEAGMEVDGDDLAFTFMA